MGEVIIDIPKKIYRRVWVHLLPPRMRNEEVCFSYVRPFPGNEAGRFEFVDWDPIPSQDFVFRSGYHIELSDQTRARVIKRAHDLGASLLEMHSHTGSRPAAFSPSDMIGFAEFVPHVLWRLRGRPYFAIVVARGSLDGLAWLAGAKNLQRLDGIAVGSSLLLPTKLSPLGCEEYGY